VGYGMRGDRRAHRPDVIDRAFLLAIAHAELFFVNVLVPYLTAMTCNPIGGMRREGQLVNALGQSQLACVSPHIAQATILPAGHAVALVMVSLVFDLLWVWQSVKMRAGHGWARTGMAWLASLEVIYLVITSDSIALPSVNGIISIIAGSLAVVAIVCAFLPSAQIHFRTSK